MGKGKHVTFLGRLTLLWGRTLGHSQRAGNKSHIETYLEYLE
jgi:hypothetical protein